MDRMSAAYQCDGNHTFGKCDRDACDFGDAWRQGYDHVGWPEIFPEVPEFITHALSFFAQLARQASSNAAQVDYVGDRRIAHGQAYGFSQAAEWLAEDLARAMWYGDGNALMWTERR